MFAEREGDVVGDRHAVEEGGTLKDEPILGAEVGQVSFPHTGERLSLEPHFPTGGSHKADHRLEEHRLAAAALAEHHERLASGDVDRDVPQHRLLPELHGEPVDLEHGWLGLIASGYRLWGGGGHGGGGWRCWLRGAGAGPPGGRSRAHC